MFGVLAANRHDVEATVIRRQHDFELIARSRQCAHGLFDHRREPLDNTHLIIDFEILMSQTLIKAGWNIRCLLPEYNVIDYRHAHADVNPTSVNDFRFTYLYRKFHNISEGLGGNYPEKLGLNGVPNNAFPQIVPAGFSNLGTNAQERQQYPIVQDQIVDNFSKTRGRHAMKFGLEGRRSRNHEFNYPTISGAFTFATTPTGLPGNAATGNGLASLAGRSENCGTLAPQAGALSSAQSDGRAPSPFSLEE